MKRRIIGYVLIMIGSVLSHAQEKDQKASYIRIGIDSRISGLSLSLLHLAGNTLVKKPPVLFIHGASFPSTLAFGFRMNEHSWMDHLSEEGHDVFALDFLGYGDSDRYPEMVREDLSQEPLGTARAVVSDIDRAVAHILRTSTHDRIYLIGHSWGATVAGYYTTKFPAKVSKLVLFAPFVNRADGVSWDEPRAPYTDLTPDERITQFVRRIPEGEEMTLEQDVLIQWGNEWLKSDPTASHRAPNTVRFPLGWKKDLFDCWNNDCVFAPEKLSVATFVIRGEWDTTLSSEDADRLFGILKNVPLKRYVVLEKSTHVAHLEKRRNQLYREVDLFLNEDIN